MGWVRRVRDSWAGRSNSFDEEARFHLDRRTEEYVAAGMSRDDAGRAALKRFGSVALAGERTGDVDLVRWIDDFRRDIGYGFRMLRRSPAVAALAILCLTFGIGANTAVFSWIEGILLRPFPLVLDQDRLFAVVGTTRGGGYDAEMSWPETALGLATGVASAFGTTRLLGYVRGQPARRRRVRDGARRRGHLRRRRVRRAGAAGRARRSVAGAAKLVRANGSPLTGCSPRDRRAAR